MTISNTHLLVPGAWLKACGYGSTDRVFPVIRVENYGRGRLIATINRDGFPWVVCVWMRGATFVNAPHCEATFAAGAL